LAAGADLSPINDPALITSLYTKITTKEVQAEFIYFNPAKPTVVQIVAEAGDIVGLMYIEESDEVACQEKKLPQWAKPLVIKLCAKMNLDWQEADAQTPTPKRARLEGPDSSPEVPEVVPLNLLNNLSAVANEAAR
jgi:hypothetical protein